MQKAMIVDGKETCDALNKKLKEGYKVVETCNMSSSCSTATDGSKAVTKMNNRPTALVIIEIS